MHETVGTRNVIFTEVGLLTFVSVSCDSADSLKGITFDFAHGERCVFNYSQGYKILPFKEVPLNKPTRKINVCERPGCDVILTDYNFHFLTIPCHL
jgi:hypothetical protein